jgi:hypothetical protein
MRLELDYGIHDPCGANERFLLPAVSYVSTYYCRRHSGQCGVTLFWGFLFQWWRGFLEIRVVTGKIDTPDEEVK